MNTLERNLNALQALVITLILFGALLFQFFGNEKPCSLCLLQRIAMFLVATGALMNCCFGPRKIHYGFVLLTSVFGGCVALRQIALHVCPSFPTFGTPFWGLSLYAWSFLIFASSIVYTGLLLIIFDRSHDNNAPMNILGHFVFWVLFLISVVNIVYTFILCGFGPCK